VYGIELPFGMSNLYATQIEPVESMDSTTHFVAYIKKAPHTCVPGRDSRLLSRLATLNNRIGRSSKIEYDALYTTAEDARIRVENAREALETHTKEHTPLLI
jgi:hypothetical protein